MIKRVFLSTKEEMDVRKIIHEKTGYLIESKSLLNQIFRRSSSAAEIGQLGNEILEFIGDQVLNFYVVKIVSKKCGGQNPRDGGFAFKIHENQFTAIKQALVNNDTLAKITDDWGIAQYLLLGTSDIKNEVARESKVKADLLEAVLGGIAVACNWDTAVLERAVNGALEMESRLTVLIKRDVKVRQYNMDNAITALKELAEQGECTMPTYKFHELGNWEDGRPKWACDCDVINDQTGISKLVYATSKKEGKKAVAYLTLCEHLGMHNEYGVNSWCNIWTYKGGELTPNYGVGSKKKD